MRVAEVAAVEVAAAAAKSYDLRNKQDAAGMTRRHFVGGP